MKRDIKTGKDFYSEGGNINNIQQQPLNSFRIPCFS